MDEGKLYVCYPIIVGNGAKYTTVNLAFAYKEKFTQAKIAIVDFDFKNPYLAYSFTDHDQIHGIDNLIDKIDAESLTRELFKENMISVNGIDVLKGTKLIGRDYLLTKTHVTTIIDFLKEIYDYIFVAVSPEPDNAGTVYALSEADEILLIVRNNISNYLRFPQAMNIVDTYKAMREEPKVIYNMYMKNSRVAFNSLFEEYGTKTVAASVPLIVETIDNNNYAGIKANAPGKKDKSPALEFYQQAILTLDPDIEI